jgi:hypothetical protein
MSKAKIALAKCIDLFCTDFNTRKNYGVIYRKFVKKMFLLKSMTKLEDLTVVLCSPQAADLGSREKNLNTK